MSPGCRPRLPVSQRSEANSFASSTTRSSSAGTQAGLGLPVAPRSPACPASPPGVTGQFPELQRGPCELDGRRCDRSSGLAARHLMPRGGDSVHLVGVECHQPPVRQPRRSGAVVQRDRGYRQTPMASGTYRPSPHRVTPRRSRDTDDSAGTSARWRPKCQDRGDRRSTPPGWTVAAPRHPPPRSLPAHRGQVWPRRRRCRRTAQRAGRGGATLLEVHGPPVAVTISTTTWVSAVHRWPAATRHLVASVRAGHGHG